VFNFVINVSWNLLIEQILGEQKPMYSILCSKSGHFRFFNLSLNNNVALMRIQEITETQNLISMGGVCEFLLSTVPRYPISKSSANLTNYS
jgi:hypothetical protein